MESSIRFRMLGISIEDLLRYAWALSGIKLSITLKVKIGNLRSTDTMAFFLIWILNAVALDKFFIPNNTISRNGPIQETVSVGY